MTSIDQLRQTLGEHADHLVDHDVSVRASCVNTRVGVVRRRRRVVAAGGLVAVVAVAGGVALVQNSSEKSGPVPASRIVGLTPPQTMSSLDYDYEFAEGVEGDGGKVRVELPASDLPRLVSWATSGDDDRVTLDSPSLARPVAYDEEDFGTWYYVAPGSGETLTVRAEEGQPGLAIYSLSDRRPDGVVQGGVTYRQQPAGLELLGATVGEPGQNEITVAATAPSEGIVQRYFCSGGPDTAYLHVVGVDGEGISGSGCEDLPPFDAVATGGTAYGTDPGDDVTTRLYVTDGKDGPIIDDPDLTIGLGLWARTDDARPTSLAGAYPETIESAGHVWRLLSRDDSRGMSSASGTVPDGYGPVLVRTYRDVGAGKVLTTIGGDSSSAEFSAGTAGNSDDLAAPGAKVDMEVVRGDVSDRALLAIGFYVRAD